MSIDSMGIHLGNLIYIRFYGVIIVTAAVVAGYVALLEARRRGHSDDLVWDGLLYSLLGGIIGARLWHVITPPTSVPFPPEYASLTEFYLNNPVQILFLWNGGLNIIGGILGGGIALAIYAYFRNLDTGEWLDIAAAPLMLAMAVGRWGDFVNQQLYGRPTDLPWGMFIEPGFRVAEYATETHFHPLFAYEFVLNLAAFGLLLWLAQRLKHWLKTGDLFLIFLIAFGVIRAIMEAMRIDSHMFGNLNTNQAIAILVAVAAGITLAVRHRRQRRVRRGTGESASDPD